MLRTFTTVAACSVEDRGDFLDQLGKQASTLNTAMRTKSIAVAYSFILTENTAMSHI